MHISSLEDLCELIVDCPHSTPTWTDAGVLVLRSQNIRNGRLNLESRSFTDEQTYEERSRRARVRDGDIVMTREAPMGEVCVIPKGLRCCLGQRMVLLRPDRAKCDERFLLYALQSPMVQHQISWSEGTGSTVSNLRIPAIRRLKIPSPPLPRQHEIGEILGVLDDKIEQNRRTTQTLERLAQAIFRAWFVDLEPVKAKAEGTTGFPSMPPEVFEALPAQFEESAIGRIPTGWEPGSIRDFANLSRQQISPLDHGEELFDHFSLPAFDAGRMPIAEPGTAIKSNKFLLVEGCILLSKLNPRIPRVWLPPAPRTRQQIASTEFLVFTPASNRDRYYLYCQFKQTQFTDQLAQSASGTSNSHQRVRPNDLLEKRVLIPPASTRAAFDQIAAPIFDLIGSVRAESVVLANLRDFLLPKLLSGEVYVRTEEPVEGTQK